MALLSQELLRHYTERNNETIDTLDPEMQYYLNRFIADVYNNLGIFLLVYSGYRTTQEQQDLYNNYLAGGNLAAPPTMSWHEFRRGADFVEINADGSANWNTSDTDYQYILGWLNDSPLQSGYSFGDKGHLWLPDYPTQTITQFKQDHNITDVQAWQSSHAPASKKAGFGGWFFAMAGVGIIISESFRRKKK